KHAKQIAEVTAKRIMPPWAPLPGYCQFEQDRSISVDEIGLIGQWVTEGVVEGPATALPPVPESPSRWVHGKPDLVLSMPEAFEIPADAKDIYRKFVIPVPITERKYVRAYDFDPVNRRVVHHAAIRVDRTGLARLRDEMDPLPGYDGLMSAEEQN